MLTRRMAPGTKPAQGYFADRKLAVDPPSTRTGTIQGTLQRNQVSPWRHSLGADLSSRADESRRQVIRLRTSGTLNRRDGDVRTSAIQTGSRRLASNRREDSITHVMGLQYQTRGWRSCGTSGSVEQMRGWRGCTGRGSIGSISRLSKSLSSRSGSKRRRSRSGSKSSRSSRRCRLLTVRTVG